MTTPRIHRTFAVLKLPTSVPALIGVARAIVQALAAGSAFPVPDPPLAVVEAGIEDLVGAEVAATARTRGAATTRDEKRAALVTLLDQLRAYVQKRADLDLEHAPALITSAGMNVKRVSPRTARAFSARQGAVSGSAQLVAPAAAHRAAYEWAYSTDGGATWNVELPTLRAQARVTGLRPGTQCWFRYRSTTRDGVSNWSDPVSLFLG